MLTTGDRLLELSGEVFGHLGRSRRLSIGEAFVTFDGSGTDKHWRVTEVTVGNIKAMLAEEHKFVNRPRVDLTLAISPLKGGKSDDIIAKGTQMGVNTFMPFNCSRTVAKLSGKRAAEKVERWNEICRQNSGFSKRSNVPVVREIINFDDVLKLTGFDVKYIFFEEQLEAAASVRIDDGLSVLALVGPEGGFEVDEVRTARDAGFELASLGPFVLKADTAALKAAGLIIG